MKYLFLTRVQLRDTIHPFTQKDDESRMRRCKTNEFPFIVVTLKRSFFTQTQTHSLTRNTDTHPGTIPTPHPPTPPPRLRWGHRLCSQMMSKHDKSLHSDPHDVIISTEKENADMCLCVQFCAQTFTRKMETGGPDPSFGNSTPTHHTFAPLMMITCVAPVVNDDMTRNSPNLSVSERDVARTHTPTDTHDIHGIPGRHHRFTLMCLP
jgi:hypothetical protein